MVAKLSLKRLLYALFLFFILVCAHFLISVKRLPDILEKQPKAKSSKKNSSKTETQVRIFQKFSENFE